MLVQIGDNFIDPKIIEAVVADKPLTDTDTGREFESKPMSIIMLNNGTSFKDSRTPEEVMALVTTLIGSMGPLDDEDKLSEIESLERITHAAEEGVKQASQIAESAKYMAEMIARLTMCIVDGQMKLDGLR